MFGSINRLMRSGRVKLVAMKCGMYLIELKSLNKGLTISRSIMFMMIYLYKRKWRILSGSYIHHTQINLCPNTQFESTKQRA